MIPCVYMCPTGIHMCINFSGRIKKKKKYHLGCLQRGKLDGWVTRAIERYFSLYNTLRLLNFEPQEYITYLNFK